jgi:hypothetical protein
MRQVAVALRSINTADTQLSDQILEFMAKGK